MDRHHAQRSGRVPCLLGWLADIDTDIVEQQGASLVGPAVYSFLLYDGSKANINTYVRVVTFAFTWGYLITFALEIVAVSLDTRCWIL